MIIVGSCYFLLTPLGLYHQSVDVCFTLTCCLLLPGHLADLKTQVLVVIRVFGRMRPSPQNQLIRTPRAFYCAWSTLTIIAWRTIYCLLHSHNLAMFLVISYD